VDNSVGLVGRWQEASEGRSADVGVKKLHQESKNVSNGSYIFDYLESGFWPGCRRSGSDCPLSAGWHPRFKIESTFREMKQVIGAFSYHFWSKSTPKLNQYLNQLTLLDSPSIPSGIKNVLRE
jgi:hypothetical protein